MVEDINDFFATLEDGIKDKDSIKKETDYVKKGLNANRTGLIRKYGIKYSSSWTM